MGSGVVNEGAVSTRLGLPGNPTAAEDVLVARDLELARLTGARLHIAHISSAGACARVRAAREADEDVRAVIAADGRIEHAKVVQVIDILRQERITKFAINVRPEEIGR